MSEDFARRLDAEVGRSASDRLSPRQAFAARAAKHPQRMAAAKEALQAIVLPTMKVLAGRLGKPTLGIVEILPKLESPGWLCAIALAGQREISVSTGDVIAVMIKPDTHSDDYIVTAFLRVEDHLSACRSEGFTLNPRDDQRLRAWVEDRLLACARAYVD